VGKAGTLHGVVQSMKVELLYWDGCPSHPEALELLRSVLGEDSDHTLTTVEVETLDDARRLSFHGSPTIRVDGRDVDPDGAAQGQPSLSCRIYRLPDGRVSPLPTRQQIEEALR
jgi:hypothetical protein